MNIKYKITYKKYFDIFSLFYDKSIKIKLIYIFNYNSLNFIHIFNK
jgi:hypothetical protein